MEGKVQNGVGFLSECQFSNVGKSGNRRLVSMRMLVSDFMTVWNPACSFFCTPVSDFVTVWDQPAVFVDACFQFHHIFEKIVKYFMDAGFRNCSNLEISVHEILHDGSEHISIWNPTSK